MRVPRSRQPPGVLKKSSRRSSLVPVGAYEGRTLGVVMSWPGVSGWDIIDIDNVHR